MLPGAPLVKGYGAVTLKWGFNEVACERMEGMVPAAQMALCHRWHLPSACLSKWCRRGIASLQSAAPAPPARGDPVTRVSDGSGEFVLSAQWARPGLFPAGSPAAAPGRALPLAPHARQPLNLLFFMHMKGAGHGEINLPGHERGTKVYTAGQPFRPFWGGCTRAPGLFTIISAPCSDSFWGN